MNYRDYLDLIGSESAALADAAASVPLTTPVPMCLDWTMAVLVTHAAQGQHWMRLLVDTHAKERLPLSALPQPPEPAALIPWFREATRAILATLGAADPAAPVWTWTNERRVGFWARRQTHEIAVHRWDAQHAAGVATPLPTMLAADGVDELLELLPFLPGTRTGAGETVRLHCTDAPGEWLVRLAPSGLEVTREHTKGDAAARGPASDLDLFLWGRAPLEALEVFGDRDLLVRLQQVTAL